MAKSSWWWWLPVVAACRPGAGGKLEHPDPELVIAQPFPDAARVEQLAAQPAPPTTGEQAVAAVDTWKLRGPLPRAVASTPARDPDGVALANVLGPGVRGVTEEMGCFARELAAFGLQHDAQPTDDLGAWIGARCGVGHGHPVVLLARKSPSGAPVLDPGHDGDAILEAANALPPTTDFGIGSADDGKHRMMVIAAVQRRVAFDRVEMVPASGRVIVTGESPVPIGWVTAFATLGDDRVARCEPAPSRRSGVKAFALACPVLAKDADTKIELAMAPAGGLLGDVVLALWASPDGSLGDTWTARRITIPVAGDEHGALAWLTAINAIRERAGLPAWTHAKAQSELVGGLLPHFTAQQTPAKLREELALAMLAGWKVDGTIRDGALELARIPLDVPLERAVGAAMASPTFRWGVLDREAATAALAVQEVSAAKVAQLAVVGYALFADREYREEEERFLDLLDADRISRGLPPVERVGGPKDRARLDASADRVRNGESAPSEELDVLLDHFAQATGQTVRGGIYTTLRLEGYRPPFEGPIANADRVVVIVKIADWRPPGSAWGQHVIYVIFAVPGDGAS